MSHVADALRKAAGTSVDPPDDADHPWGAELNRLEPAFHSEPGLSPREGLRVRATGVPTALDTPPPRLATRPVAVPRPLMTTGTSEQTRSHLAALVQRVFLPVSGEPARAVAFSGLGTESALITATAADMLAQQTGAQVCLVDANFAAPTLHAHFGQDNIGGFAEAIRDGLALSTAARELSANLSLLPSGRAAAPSFASEAVRLQMAQFLAEFDYVVIDIGPLSESGPAVGLAPLLSGVILVMAAEATRRESARQVTQMLTNVGASVIGAVLTNRHYPIPDALYRRL
jgi:protein-tyrosine kinase